MPASFKVPAMVCLRLIDEILDLSKIESGKMKLEFNPVTLVEIADDMNSIFAPMAKEKNLKFSIHIAENAPPQIVTDVQRLEQVLKNLFSNALKFTARGSVTMDSKCHRQSVCQLYRAGYRYWYTTGQAKAGV